METDSSNPLNDALAQQNFELALELCESNIANGDQSSQLAALRGWCLYKIGRLKDAETALVAAFNRDSKNHYVASTVISFYMERGQYEQVITLTQYCVGLHADDRLMWHRLGTAQFMLGDLAGSTIAFRRSLEVEYSNATAFALSQPLLCQGQYAEGFKLYEHRFDSYTKLNWPQSERMPMPQWQGEPLKDRSILVWSEQGFGDCIQFGRLITTLAEQGATVDLMLPNNHASLAPILESIKGLSKIQIISKREVVLTKAYDFHSPLMSLMRGLNLEPERIPRVEFPYIHVKPEATQANALLPSKLAELNQTKTLKVGLVWSTALKASFMENDYLHFLQKERKSLTPDEIQPVLEMGKDYSFYSLHTEKSPALERTLEAHAIDDLAPCIKSFADTAALINSMDLVISIDTSVAHLAGALNKPVINLLPFAADWRWQNNREDTPWYPSMRLLRQHFRGDWSGVVKRLEDLLPTLSTRYTETGEVFF